MEQSHPSNHGPSGLSSRRRSPAILDPSHFSAGAVQTQGWPYDATCNYTTIATPNGQYQSTTQVGYLYPPQAAESSHTQTAEYAYTQPVAPSSRYQNYNVYPNYTQSYLQAGASHHSVPAEWPQSSHYDPSVQPLVSYSLTRQHATATASSSSSQHTPDAKSSSSKTQTSASKPTASASRLRKGIIPDMKSKMNRFRVANMTSTIPPESPLIYQPQPPAVGEKRKERSPTPDSIRAQAPLKKDAKRRETQKIKSQKSRDQLHSDIAELAERLPSHLRAPGDMSSRKNITRAATYIDEQNVRIGRLENEVGRSHSEADQLRESQVQLTSQVLTLNLENRRLAHVNEGQRFGLVEKDMRIADLQNTIQTWQHPY